MTARLRSPAAGIVRRRTGIVLAAFIFVTLTASAGDAQRQATEALGRMTQPLAFGLDMASFNGEEKWTREGENGEVLPRFDRFLKAQGISTLDWTMDDLKKIRSLLARDIPLSEKAEKELDDAYGKLKDRQEKIEKSLQKNHDNALLKQYLEVKEESEPVKTRRNRLRSFLQVEKPLMSLIGHAADNPDNARLTEEACNVSLRALYSLFAAQLMEERDGKGFGRGVDGWLRVAQQFVCSTWLNDIPIPSNGRRNRPIGSHGAAKEASNLLRGEDSTRFLSPKDLAALTPTEVAALDLSPTDPMWHTHHRMETSPPDTWKEIETWICAAVTEKLNEKKKFRKKNPGFTYDLQEARTVLFWEKVKTTATSPKVDVTDALGQAWKLKWGEECAVEPITNHLRLQLGAKLTDLVYTDADAGSHLLILCSESQRRMNPGTLMPVTEDELVAGLKESAYHFNVKPFIRSSGKITRENAGTILKKLAPAAVKGYRAGDLVGRTWISFRESMVEVKHDVINRGGPIENFTESAASDRALRQSFMIALWLEEYDCKEDNFRSTWMKNFAGNTGEQYFEFFHDAGSALGGLGRTGELNDLDAGSGPHDFMWLGPLKRKATSNCFQLYRPRIWDHITFADAYAGARHIARLSRADIAKAVRYSGMPDFWQEAAVWRLASRRDTMAGIFGLSVPDPVSKAPTITIPLTTRSDRQEAARRYRLPLALIEEDLVHAGALSPNQTTAITKKPVLDVVVRNGILQPYEKTILPAILRDVRHPPGFVKRMARWEDNKEFESKRVPAPH